eukprot:TRINITY_DN101113_c0_g1_i1.p1 TRINITY_DN101113_c0_g1~~TRINITY_DN101113_c0_g1_i1.p1  ORF type:complete len:358 (-),score=60.50 TRINITY_DN101113_c0_g1_i1:117-1190(-)
MIASEPVHVDSETESRMNSRECETPPAPAVQFTKTKMCKFEALGICSKGSECPFAHGETELQPLPDLRCTKICKILIKTGACQDPTCTYAHTKEELRTIASTSSFKTKMCRFMSENGHCVIGSKCNFAHSPDELRDRPAEPPVKAAAKQTPVKQQQQQRQTRQAPKAPQQKHQPSKRGQLDLPGVAPSAKTPSPVKESLGQLRPPPGLASTKGDASAGGTTASFPNAVGGRKVGPSPDSPAYISTMLPSAIAPPAMNMLPPSHVAVSPWFSSGAAALGLPPRHVEEILATFGGHGAPGSDSVFSSALFGRQLFVDQKDGVVTIKDNGVSALSDKRETMSGVPAVRTSATTLCSLADM